MGTLVGHVAPGFAFLALGLWHLLNHIKLHSLHQNSYRSSPWFPTSRIKYLELYVIMVGSLMSMAMELVIGPEKHQPFDTDGSIPTNHLHNFEHATISFTFFTYAALAVVLDRFSTSPKTIQHGLTQLVGAIAFGQQFLLFHLHSADHMGMEGQYHLLLQLIVLVSLITTLLGIGYPRNFLVSLVRSASITFQGAWFILMGYMLWTPSLIPKGCFINDEEGHQVVRCHGGQALHRAKSLVNLQFSWFLVGVTIFSISFYLVLDRFYSDQKVDYSSILTKEEEEEEEEEGEGGQDSDDVESQKNQQYKLDESKSFIAMGKAFASLDMER